MKNDFDKELDSLLRGHTATARRDAASSPAQQPVGGASSRGERTSSTVAHAPSHLDADELNAYAENALPAATRARYMAHLADCDSCRKIATDIALAAGVAGELEKRAAVPAHAEAASAASWRERLAAIFAPRVLRYVAPALAVLFVGVVGFVALRQSNDLSPVAGRVQTADESPNVTTSQKDSAETKQAAPSSPSEASAPANADEVAKSSQPTTTVAPGTVGSVAGGGAAVGGAGQPIARPDVLADEPPPPPPAETAAKKAGPPAASAPEDFTVNKSEQLSAAANQQREAAQNSTAQNSVTINEQEYSRGESTSRVTQNSELNRADTGDFDSPRRGTQRAETQTRSRTSQTADRSIEEAGVDASEAPAPKPSAEGRQLAKGARKQNASKSRRDERAADDSPADETRTVAGRRFRRQRGVWIDTAFTARTLIDVRRGSEQFRALVADEQGLRSIASQLPGEVIVIWKNRAYRIR